MQSTNVTASFCATVVDEWCRLGVRHAVVAPGSRSTPMVVALASAPDITLHVFHDERSAAFAALGISTVTRLATLLLCTSGTAAANFYPAIIEASHNEVPLLVMTADRPPELQGVGAAQTIDQRNLYGNAVRLFIDAGVPDDDDTNTWRRTARRALGATQAERAGPVHLNLPFREPLLDAATPLVVPRDETTSLNRPKTAALGTNVLSQLAAHLDGRRGVIVAGARGAEQQVVAALAAHLRWPILADPLGGSRTDNPNAIRHADAWLRDADVARNFTPEVVLRLGTLPASKVVNGWLRESGADIVAVSASPFLIDPDRRVSLHVVGDPATICADIMRVTAPVDAEWSERWQRAEAAARRIVAQTLDVEPVLSEPGVARTLVATLPANANLVVSSSMPIRDVEWYAGACDHLVMHSNRGVNGIDGVVSTAVGIAAASRAPTGLLIGDIAFMHDINGLLGIAERSVDLRVVVVDNRGGGIFSFLPQRATLGSDTFERLFGTPHRADLVGLAAAHGVATQVAATSQQLLDAVQLAGPRVTVVKTSREENVVQHDVVHQAIIAAVNATL